MNARLLALLLCCLPATAFGRELPVATSIDEVTVHPSTATVIRRGAVRLPTGDVRLHLEGLAPGLLDDSVRLEAGGRARARILGVSVERQPLPESTDPEVRAAEDALRALELRDRALADEVAAAKKQKEFLDALRATTAKEQSQAIAAGAASPRTWREMIAFLGSEYARIDEEIRRTETARALLQGEIEAARQELDRIRSQGGRSFKRVVVDLHVERAGEARLALQYLVHGAGWQPKWDAHLDPAAGRVDLGLQAEVRQRTGESWEGVRLAVTSAEPNRQAHVPEVHPLYLVRERPSPPPMMQRAAVPRSVATESEVADRDESGAYAFARQKAEVQVQLLSVRYEAPDRATIPSTGEPRRTFLASWPIEAELRRVAAPAIDAHAWLTAQATNDTGVPLLAGQVELFVAGAFVGRTHLAEVPEGGDLELAFGADPRIAVERTVLDRTRENTGLFSRRDRWTYRIRTTIRSHYDEPVQVEVVDRLPVSRDEDIEVEPASDVITAGYREDEGKPGVRTWTLEIPAGKEKAIELGYRVSHPRGVRVHGLP